MTDAETTKITPEVVGKQELVKRIAKQTDVTQKQVGEIFGSSWFLVNRWGKSSPHLLQSSVPRLLGVV